MPSRADARLRVITIAILFTAFSPAAVSAQTASKEANTEPPGQAEIAGALEIVKSDSNLATDRRIKTLRWKDSTSERRSGTPAWLAGLFNWFAESARVVMWCAVAALAGALFILTPMLLRLSGFAR